MPTSVNGATTSQPKEDDPFDQSMVDDFLKGKDPKELDGIQIEFYDKKIKASPYEWSFYI